MNTKQQTIPIIVLIVSLLLSGCQAGIAPATSTPTAIPPTPTQKPLQIPPATRTPLSDPTTTPEPSPSTIVTPCPGSPYSLNSTSYTIPADTSAKLKSLIQQMSDPDPVIRASAATWIEGTGQEAELAIPFLVVLSRDQAKIKWQTGYSTTPGTEAINAIAAIKGDCGFLALRTIAEGDDQISRDRAIQILGNTYNPAALKILYDLLHDSNLDVRSNALYSLGALISNQVYDDNSLENLMAVAVNNNENDDIRSMAMKDIGFVGINKITARDQAIDVLLLLTKDSEPSIRSGAAQVLSGFNDPIVIDTLIFMLQDQDSLVTFYAADSLAKITGKNFGNNYGMWKAWWSTQK